VILVASERDDRFTVIRPRFLCDSEDMDHGCSSSALVNTLPCPGRWKLSAFPEHVTREQLRLGTDLRGWGHLDCYHHQVEFSHARGEVVQKNTHTTVPEPINLYTFKTLKSARHQETLAV
jgi:hypothetical protein